MGIFFIAEIGINHNGDIDTEGDFTQTAFRLDSCPSALGTFLEGLS